MPITQAQKRWMKEHTSEIKMRLSHSTDNDILQWLDQQPSKQGAIRAVLKEHIRREREQVEEGDDNQSKLTEDDKRPEGV